MRAILLAVILCLPLTPAYAQTGAQQPIATDMVTQPTADDPVEQPPQMTNAGRLPRQLSPSEQFAWTSLLVLVAAVISAGMAALHDLTAKRLVRRVPLRPMLAEARDFFALYWRRTPVPISLFGVFGTALGLGLRNHPNLLLFGLAGVLLFGAIPWAVALQLGGATLAPDDTVEAIDGETGELRPARLHLAAVSRRIVEATVILGVMLLAADLALSLSVTLLNGAGEMTAVGFVIPGAGIAGLYLLGRLHLFIPRAGLGRGASLRGSWALTRGALLPAAVIFLGPLTVLILFAVAIDAIPREALGKLPVGLGALLATVVGLCVLPFLWGAQIAMLRVLEPVPEA